MEFFVRTATETTAKEAMAMTITIECFLQKYAIDFCSLNLWPGGMSASSIYPIFLPHFPLK
jgi:hypothetical protein